MNNELYTVLCEAAHPLRTPVADPYTQDLQPLKEILRGVRILGLGESTHGTREIFQLKHRLVRFLVEEMGFRVFTIEAGLEPCRAIDDYVMMGKGDGHRALSLQGYWTWDTAEVSDMIDWMREHNLRCKRGDECRFFGIDMKPIEGACDSLLDFVRPLAGKDSEQLEKLILRCRNTFWMKEGQEIPEVYWLLGWLQAHERMLIEGSCPEAYRLAVENARYIFQYIDCMRFYSKNDADDYGKRDFYMAENVSYLMNELPPDSKIILWAHNGHIAVDKKADKLKDNKNLGWHLRQRYGSQYYPCAVCFGTGGFQSRQWDDGGEHSLQGFTITKPPQGSWNEDLDNAFKHSAYLDLRTQLRKTACGRDWLKEKKPFLSVGSGYAPSFEHEKWMNNFSDTQSLGECFDGLFFLKTVQRARPNVNGMR